MTTFMAISILILAILAAVLAALGPLGGIFILIIAYLQKLFRGPFPEEPKNKPL
jgi:hypothetical protein